MTPNTEKKHQSIRYNPETGDFEIVPEGCDGYSIEQMIAEMVTDYDIDITC